MRATSPISAPQAWPPSTRRKAVADCSGRTCARSTPALVSVVPRDSVAAVVEAVDERRAKEERTQEIEGW
jgi:hypothetical protein